MVNLLMAAEEFIQWALDPRRTDEEAYFAERVVELGVARWHWHNARRTVPTSYFHSLMDYKKERRRNPAHRVVLERHNVERAVEALSKDPELSLLCFQDRPIRDISGLRFFPYLRKLFSESTEITDLTPLAAVPQLERLMFHDAVIEDLRPLSALTRLRYLDISCGRPWPIVDGIHGMESLEELTWQGNLLPLEGLETFPRLRRVRLTTRDHALPLRDLLRLPEMPALDLLAVNALNSLDGLERYPRLRNLNLNGCFSDLRPLTSLPSLTHVSLSSTSAFDLEPLSHLFASLVDDPGEHLPESEAEVERQRLFGLIERLVEWDCIHDVSLLTAVQQEIKKSTGASLPAFLDPFCGGGTIPLEAQRLGLRAHAADLNPVAVLLTKTIIEVLPSVTGREPVNPASREKLGYGLGWAGTSGFAEDVRYYAEWMRAEAERLIGCHYGKPNQPTVAWLWARTVVCPNPSCRAHTPLINKFWVSTHKGNEAWVRPIVDKQCKTIRFEVVTGNSVPPKGTVNRSGAVCLVCDLPISFDHIRSEGQQSRLGIQLMGSVVEGDARRIYLSPDPASEKAALAANPSWWPETDLPPQALGFRVQKYGITKHKDLFTKRQLLALTTFCELLDQVMERVLVDANGDKEYAKAIRTFLSFAIDRLAQTNNTLVRWLVRKSGTSKGTPAFDRQIVPMAWEFSEGNVFGKSVGSWTAAVANPLSALNVIATGATPGKALQVDAAAKYGLTEPPVVSTDPPYFDNIGYADLSDFYYVWLRRSLGSVYPELFKTLLTPKHAELISAPHRFQGDRTLAKAHFMEGLKQAFHSIAQLANASYPITVYYAFKQVEEDQDEESDSLDTAVASTGWETMLEALLGSGLSVTGTWPIGTEQLNRMRAVGANALASSIVFVCRPRPKKAAVVSRRDFLTALKNELPDALRAMQKSNIAPVDLAQAAIGPGMAVFSRYARVLETDGSPMSVRTALSLINQSLDEVLAEQEGEFDADTRWALAWFDQYGFTEGPYGAAETLCTAKNTSVSGMVEAGILTAKAGKVRLLKKEELPADWDPATDKRLPIWEITHHLIRRLEQGESGAADLIRQLGVKAEVARDLSYRLYTICERRKWATDAIAYNTLVLSWTDVQRLAAEKKPTAPAQGELI